MPRFTLRFIGMALFVRHKDDARVDVRFVTASGVKEEHAGHGGPSHSALEHRHVPLLFMSPDSWEKTSEDGTALAGRAPGRLIYLPHWKTVTIEKGGKPVGTKVEVSGAGGGPAANPPETKADWDNFDQLILKLSVPFPNGKYSDSQAQVAAPDGLIQLNGGRLSSEPPSIKDGEVPWQLFDGTTDQQLPAPPFHFTDVATYSFDFAAGEEIRLRLINPDKKSTLLVHFKTDRDINGWVAHEPLAGAFAANQSGTVQHVHVAAEFVDPRPAVETIPEIRATKKFLHPDDKSCPPFQVQL